MNKAIITISSVLVAVNLLCGLIVTAFGWFNIIISTLIIVLTTILLLAVFNLMNLKDGYKVSLSFIIPILGVIEYVLSVFMPNRMSDNWCLILIILLFLAEVVIVSVAQTVSNKIR